MVLKPEKEQEAEAIFRKWGLDFAVIGGTTRAARFVVRHGGEVKADLPIKELGDEAPLYDRPWTKSPPSPVLDAASIAPPMPTDAALDQADRLARSLLEALDIRAIRHTDPRQYDAGARRRRRGGAARRRAEGLGADCRLHRALLRRRSARGGKTGGGRGVAQPDRRRRAPARAHRQSQFRQSGAPRDDGRTGRLHRGHRRGRAGARLSGRLRQCLALQRDDGRRRFRRRRRSGASDSSRTWRRRRPSLSRRRARIFCSSAGRRDGSVVPPGS